MDYFLARMRAGVKWDELVVQRYGATEVSRGRGKVGWKDWEKWTKGK